MADDISLRDGTSVFTPTGAASIDVAYGVDGDVSGYIIQSEDKTETSENLTIQDQKGRTCQVIAYDKGTTLSLTVIGPATAPSNWAVGSTVTYGGVNYIVQSLKRTCTYNDTAKWQIEAVHYEHANYSNKINSTL